MFNVYQLNILNNIMFLHKISTKTAPSVFDPHFQKPSNFKNPANFLESNYSLPGHN